MGLQWPLININNNLTRDLSDLFAQWSFHQKSCFHFEKCYSTKHTDFILVLQQMYWMRFLPHKTFAKQSLKSSKSSIVFIDVYQHAVFLPVFVWHCTLLPPAGQWNNIKPLAGLCITSSVHERGLNKKGTHSVALIVVRNPTGNLNPQWEGHTGLEGSWYNTSDYCFFDSGVF